MEKLEQMLIREKNYTPLQAKKAAYQTRITIRSFIFTLILALILSNFGYFKETILLFIFYKLFRSSMGGLHLHGKITCFIFSLATILITIFLYRNIDFHAYHSYGVYLEISFWLYIIILWIKYVPRGTSQRPFRKKEEIRKLKILSCIYLLLLFGSRWINFDFYSLDLFSALITITLTTPILYKIFGVKTDRTPDCKK